MTELTDALAEAMARDWIERHGLGWYDDPMEGGQDAYDICQDAFYDMRDALAAMSRVLAERGIKLTGREATDKQLDAAREGIKAARSRSGAFGMSIENSMHHEYRVEIAAWTAAHDAASDLLAVKP